jgi:hypothetical protein
MNNYKSPPMFPPKSFGKLSGKNLEKRKLELNAYLNFFLESGGFNMSNIVDALSSFLQVIHNSMQYFNTINYDIISFRYLNIYLK